MPSAKLTVIPFLLAAAVALPAASADANEADYVADKLEQPINLDRGIPANTPLHCALKFLGERHHLTIRLDQKAFEAAGEEEIEAMLVQVPRMVGVRLGVVLRELLGQIVLGDGRVAGLQVRNGVVEVVPQDALDPEEPWVPRSLRRRLLRPVVWDQDIPEGTPLPEALEMIGRRYSEKFTIDIKAFEVTGAPLPEKVRVPLMELKGAEVSLAEILDWLMEMRRLRSRYYRQTGLENGRSRVPPTVALRRRPLGRADRIRRIQPNDYLVYYRVMPQGIELTAVNANSPEAFALFKSLDAVRRLGNLVHGEPDPAAFVASLKLSRQLARPVNLDVAVNANTRLRDALEYIADKFDLTLIIDTNAFSAVGIDKVEERTVQLAKQKDVPLSVLLDQLLDQVHKGDWKASWIIRRDYVELTPELASIYSKKPLTREQLDRLWHDLAGGDQFLIPGLLGRLRYQIGPDGLVAGKQFQVYQASQALLRHPHQATALLGERLKPPPPPDPKEVAEARRWAKDLDSAQFAARQKATEELDKLGRAAIPALRERLKNQPALELSKRVETLLKKLEPPPEERLRTLRALRLLEEIGTPECERVLEMLARGEPDAWQTEKAKSALERFRN
jgi:hypothetical protein